MHISITRSELLRLLKWVVIGEVAVALVLGVHGTAFVVSILRSAGPAQVSAPSHPSATATNFRLPATQGTPTIASAAWATATVAASATPRQDPTTVAPPAASPTPSPAASPTPEASATVVALATPQLLATLAVSPTPGATATLLATATPQLVIASGVDPAGDHGTDAGRPYTSSGVLRELAAQGFAFAPQSASSRRAANRLIAPQVYDASDGWAGFRRDHAGVPDAR